MRLNPSVEFLRAELDAGFTFVSLATDAHAGAEKRQRNRRNALAAVAAIERFLPKVVAQSRSELGDIADGLQRLKRAIRTSRRPSNRS